MRKIVALTAIAGAALASDFDGAVDNNLAASLIDLPRIQRHPLYLDSDVSGNEALEIIHQRELIRNHFPILSKQIEAANHEMFAPPTEMEYKDRRPIFSVFEKKKGEKSEQTEKGEDHELSVFLNFVRTQPKDIQRAIFEAHPIFTTNTRTQPEAKDEGEIKNTQQRSNYSVFDKREAAVKPVTSMKPIENSTNNGRTAYNNFSKKEASVQKVQKELGALYAKWLNQELLQNDDELYGIKNIMKKDKDSWKGGVLSLDDEDNELLVLSDLIDESYKTRIASSIVFTKPAQPQPQPKPQPQPSVPKKDYKSILTDAVNAINQVKEKNTNNPALRPIIRG